MQAVQETWVWSLGQEDPLEEGMATHSSILAWRIPWTEEPGGLQCMGLQRVRHDWVMSCCCVFPKRYLQCCSHFLPAAPQIKSGQTSWVQYSFTNSDLGFSFYRILSTVQNLRNICNLWNTKWFTAVKNVDIWQNQYNIIKLKNKIK